MRSRLSSLRQIKACVCAQSMHPRSKDSFRAQQSTFQAPKASDDARGKCMKIALVKYQAFKECVRAQRSTWAASKASDDAPERMKICVIQVSKQTKHTYCFVSCQQVMLLGLRRERECMKSRSSSIKSKISMRRRTNHEYALRTAPGLLPRPQNDARASACKSRFASIRRSKHAFAARTAPGLLSGIRQNATRVHANHALQVSGEPSKRMRTKHASAARTAPGLLPAACMKRCANLLIVTQYQANRAKKHSLVWKPVVPHCKVTLQEPLRSALTAASVCPS